MGSAFFFGLTCPANADSLVNADNRAFQSPMTVALQNAGWQAGFNLINVFIFITCLSACNSSIFIGSRTVLYMAQSGMAPRFLGYTNGRGVPVWAILLTNAFGALSMMNVSTGASQAYTYIVNLSGVSTFLVWGSISFIHIRFRTAWAKQGRTKAELPFKSMLYPWNAYFGLGATMFLALVQGWTTLAPFDAGTFVDAYILLVLFPIVFVLFKFRRTLFRYKTNTEFMRSWQIDLDSGRRVDLDQKGIVRDDSDVEVGAVSETRMPMWKRLGRNF